MSSVPRRRIHLEFLRWTLPAVLLAAFVIRAMALAQLHDHPLLQPEGELDPGYYVALAKQVAAGDWAAGDRVYFVSPLYIYFVALIFLLTGGSVLAVQIVQIALGTAAVGLVASTARMWFGAAGAVVTGVLAAVTGHFTFNEVLVLQSSLDPFLAALALFLLARACIGSGAKAWLVSGVALGMFALNRPNAILAAGVLAACAIVQATSRGRSLPNGGNARAARVWSVSSASAFAMSVWRPAVGLVLGLALTLFPVALRNLAVTGELALVSSHGGLNFYIGNNPDADGTYRSVEGITPSIAGQDRDARRVAETAEGRALSDGEVSSYFYRQAWAWIAGHPLQAFALFLKKVAYMLNGDELPLNFSYASYSRDVASVLRLLPAGPPLLLPLGLFGWLFAGPRLLRERHVGDARARADVAAWWVWTSFIPAYIVSVALFFVADRYRVSLLMALCVTTAPAVLWMKEALARLWQGAWRIEAPALAALAGVIVICHWPTHLDDGRVTEQTEMLVYLAAEGREQELLALLPRTEAMHRQPALLLYRVGAALRSSGRTEAALPFLERARRFEPARPEVALALGQTLLDLGRAGDAIPHLRAALDRGAPRDVANFDLARAFAALGRRDDARRALGAIEDVMRLDGVSANAVARLALDLDDAALAERAASRAVVASPSAAPAHETLGLVLARLGRTDEAIAELEVACRLDASSATARLNLGVLYAEAGRIDEARALAEQALVLQPDYERARQFLAALSRKTSRAG